MKKILYLFIAIIIIFLTFKLLSNNPSNDGVSYDSADLIVFWGNGCPHCEKVKEYINNNNLEKSVKISYKEVYYDKNNQKLLQESVKKCPEIDMSQGIGVPLAVVKKTDKCLYGDTPIIDWLKSQVIK